MTQRDIDDLTMVIYFLLYLEQEQPHAMYGSYMIKDVVDAIARLHRIPPEPMRRLIQ